jgi:nicotinamidase-related amidase
MELQQGVVGDCASMPALRDAAVELRVLENCGRLASAARSHEIPVIHAVVSWRADRRGTGVNTPLLAAMSKNPEQMLQGSRAVELIDELGDTSDDLFSERSHGLTPFTGTNLDSTLRSLGVSTVLACGVSLNIGVLGLCLSAADLGYEVLLCRDATVGLPIQYGEQVIEHTLSLLGTVSTTQALLDHWG